MSLVKYNDIFTEEYKFNSFGKKVDSSYQLHIKHGGSKPKDTSGNKTNYYYPHIHSTLKKLIKKEPDEEDEDEYLQGGYYLNEHNTDKFNSLLSKFSELPPVPMQATVPTQEARRQMKISILEPLKILCEDLQNFMEKIFQTKNINNIFEFAKATSSKSANFRKREKITKHGTAIFPRVSEIHWKSNIPTSYNRYSLIRIPNHSMFILPQDIVLPYFPLRKGIIPLHIYDNSSLALQYIYIILYVLYPKLREGDTRISKISKQLYILIKRNIEDLDSNPDLLNLLENMFQVNLCIFKTKQSADKIEWSFKHFKSNEDGKMIFNNEPSNENYTINSNCPIIYIHQLTTVWTKIEDNQLKEAVQEIEVSPKKIVDQNKKWIIISKKIAHKNYKQCQLRWQKYLRQRNKENFLELEEGMISTEYNLELICFRNQINYNEEVQKATAQEEVEKLFITYEDPIYQYMKEKNSLINRNIVIQTDLLENYYEFKEVSDSKTDSSNISALNNWLPFIIENMETASVGTSNSLQLSDPNSYIGQFIYIEPDDVGKPLPILKVEISPGKSVDLLIGSTHKLYKGNNLVGRFIKKNDTDCDILWCENYPEKLLS